MNEPFSSSRNYQLVYITAIGLWALSAARLALTNDHVIVTTDGEIDDRCSMIRFLLYANEWDVKGIIHSSSKHHWKGDGTNPGHHWEPVSWLDRQLDAYAKIYPSLRLHDPEYPAPEYLRAQVFVGNVALEGDMRAPTAGSNRIVDVLLEPNDTTVWLQAWGGSNTIARALKTIQEEHSERVKDVTKKARVYLITEQDNTLKTYLRPEWPGLQILRSGGPSFGAIAYDWKRIQPRDIQSCFEREWMTKNILTGHGALCEMYEAKEGRFRSEGDTPALLHVIDTGLRSHAHPSFGGWGGRFAFSHGVWKSVDKKHASPHSILRWARDFQHDWAARADWCVESYERANHPPQVLLTGAADLQAHAGDVVRLSANRSYDPDQDALTYLWWHYVEAGSYHGPLQIQHAHLAEVEVAVPMDARAGDTLHVVCQVSDDGEPPLTRYQRVIITVAK